MIKDLLKSMVELNSDSELNAREKMFVYCLIQNHNVKCGYAYPGYKELKAAIGTKRNETVSSTIKSLVEKGVLKYEQVLGENNHYFLQKFLYFVEASEVEQPKVETVQKVESVTPVHKVEKVVVKEVFAEPVATLPVDGNGLDPMEGQVHMSEIVAEDIQRVVEYTGLSEKQSIELIKESNNNVDLVIAASEYAYKHTGERDRIGYIKWGINNPDKVYNVGVMHDEPHHTSKELKFNNFEGRQYDYDNLEKKLLGWDNDDKNSIYANGIINY